MLSNKKDNIRDFFFRSDRGKILFTIRYRHIAHQFAQNKIINFERTNEDEAKKLLRNSLVIKPINDTEQNMFEFLEFLIYLPLVIIQAVLYINVKTISVFQYINLLKGIPGDIINLLEKKWENYNRDSKQAYTILNIWVVSFKQIRKNLGIAKLFNFIAHIKFKTIPLSILPPIGSELKRNMEFGIFCGYLFLKKQGNNTIYNIYRLVHFVLQIWVNRQNNTRE